MHYYHARSKNMFILSAMRRWIRPQRREPRARTRNMDRSDIRVIMFTRCCFDYLLNLAQTNSIINSLCHSFAFIIMFQEARWSKDKSQVHEQLCLTDETSLRRQEETKSRHPLEINKKICVLKFYYNGGHGEEGGGASKVGQRCQQRPTTAVNRGNFVKQKHIPYRTVPVP